ncbi:MAG: ATP-binding protein, partial [Acidobacteria bacterium]|nr:ATP-binding protein [Acidobacteriota bacterium]
MRIRVLPDGLVARIAAGEVVERPASVVRELVENALDAGGRRISVEVEAGGKRRIRVTDDGHGMGPEDAVAAFRRHATSKIRRFEDLEELTTLGFRGEALPSIAAVSRVRMRTCPDPEGAGTRLRVEGGEVTEAAAAAGPRGTVVEVEGLFEGLPVRRRFLRSIPTELAHITDLMNRFAVAHPGIDFRLRADGRSILEAPPAAGPGDRIRQVFGADFLAALVPVQGR